MVLLPHLKIGNQHCVEILLWSVTASVERLVATRVFEFALLIILLGVVGNPG